MKCLLITMFLVVFTVGVGMAEDSAVKTFKAEDYGAVADGKTDCGPAVRKAIAEAIASGGPAEVTIGPGRYIMRPEKEPHHIAVIYRAKDLTVRGVPGKTELIIDSPRNSGILIAECENVFLKDLAFDYDPAPFTQGTIVGVDPEAGTLDLDIDEGMPLLSEPWFSPDVNQFSRWGVIIDRKERRLKAGVPDHTFMTGWTHVKDRVWRMTAEDYQKDNMRFMAVGDRFVYLARIGQAVVAIYGSRDCGTDNVIVYTSSGLASGVVANTGDITMRRFQVRFRPGTKRLLTCDADGIHCQQNRGRIIVEDCFFEGMADDSINIYTPVCVITEVRSPTEIVATKMAVIKPDDSLQVFNTRQGIMLAEVKAAGVKDVEGGMLITLDKPVEGVQAGKDHRTADHVYNVSASGARYVIRNCVMRNHRRHGIYGKPSNGLIEGNTFEGLGGLGVVVGNCAEWPEGPVPSNTIIRNNRFKGCGYSQGYADSPIGAALQIWGAKQGWQIADSRVLENITVEGNTFTDSRGLSLLLGAVKGARVVNNKITSSADVPACRQSPAILIDNCSGIVMDGNIVTDPRAWITSAVEITDSVDAGDKGVKLGDLKATLSPSSVRVKDDRKQGTP